jgi:predicted MPP superfamily phosphohydrolase
MASEERIDRQVGIAMFFAVFLVVYGGIQVYAMSKVVAACGWTGSLQLLAWGWAAAMTLAPFLVWRLEQCDCRFVEATFAGIAYGWMGVSFLFFWLALALDLLRLAGRWLSLPMPDVQSAFLLCAATAIALSVYGIYAAWHPRIERLQIHTAKLPSAVGRLRIVQISDLHLGVMMGPRRLPPILETVKSLAPDILVSTGDLVDGGAHHLEGLAPLFAAIQPRYGKYAVTGNHEYIKGVEQALAFHRQAGFRVLRGEAVAAAPGLVIAGVDDPGRRRPGVVAEGADTTDAGPLLAGLPTDKFVLFLRHQPLIPEGAAGHFDLQLSGHTHDGQIFPFRYLVQLRYPHIAGLYELPGGSRLYVSRGTGTWGPPMRLLAPAEITVIDLLPY